MAVVIEKIDADRLAAYATVPMTFEVRSKYCIDDLDTTNRRPRLCEQPVAAPYTKDYDADGGGPLSWPRRFDISQWGIWIARRADEIVGGAAVAWNTPAVGMLEGQTDLAVLWDLRVRPDARRQGIGQALFRTAVGWSALQRCKLLKIETQNVNVGACRFYAGMGCYLGGIDRTAYKDCPKVADEIMLLWYLDLQKQCDSA